MLIIGITGGTGAGKTTLLNEFEAAGACTIDCDALYHELLSASGGMLSEIECEFGAAVNERGLDRKALGSIVFADEEALCRLNAITHKYVALEADKKLLDAEKAGTALAAVDAVALIESGLSKKCDVVVGVLAPPEKRISRIMTREGITREYAEIRIGAQKQDDFYRKNCDYILENDFGTEGEFRLECRKLIEIISKKGG